MNLTEESELISALQFGVLSNIPFLFEQLDGGVQTIDYPTHVVRQVIVFVAVRDVSFSC